MEDTALKLIFERNSFFRRQYFLALACFGLSVMVIVVLGFVLIYLQGNPTRPVYFATDKVGKLIRIVPVSQPGMTTEDAMAWAEKVVEKSYAYDYVNYRTQLQEAQRYFTSYGWRNYMSALKASNNLVALTERKWVVTANVVDKPKLLTQGILAGAYAWKFEMPLLVTNWAPPYNEASKFTNPLIVTVIVQRQPILQSVDGLGVVQMVGRLAF